ncbi:UDP-2-acetamido-2,6-beta-L-arabino-hexul-4-ose reductase [Agromyces sp. 3263]|uniref:polysaccharide biosynthesis C-terminal domain-containing protein n=1 Tax=Agromyces sp. 3263 TaxID=2817750 RepID=UPI00285A9B04|nr:NAD-dependent epimerase/dehydratase family protein [Agromyces sp. 3263]MDR6904800.1 UDP-2-acetamido-2,6-beta-L-arabino-hexul-4-ose reductase [Agromyces sp. 3263]
MFAVTGAGGFLGWHTRVAVHAGGGRSSAIALGERFDLERTTNAMSGAQRAIHLAGVNRGNEAEVSDGNVRLAEQFAEALLAAEEPPPVVVFANSTQSLGPTLSAYGEAKKRSAGIIERACARRGIRFGDVVLPNLFGEHGRPFYNSVFATFATLIAEGREPAVDVDRPLALLHAQDAADVLTGAVSADLVAERVRERTVSELLADLTRIAEVYRNGEIPELASTFDRDLFNSYRSYTLPTGLSFTMKAHADERGSFAELVRAHGGESQTSVSTTHPGITRGQHFHRRKVERFIVISGTATIAMRRLFTDQILEFEVSGDAPHAVDMPTMWAHRITNTGTDDLLTAFWTNELFDPAHPDTIAEDV